MWQGIKELLSDEQKYILQAANCKYVWIDKLLQNSASSTCPPPQSNFDKIAIHPLTGVPLALCIMLLVIALSMIIALPFMTAFSLVIPLAKETPRFLLPSTGTWSIFTSLVTDAVIPSMFMALIVGIFVSGTSLVFAIIEDKWPLIISVYYVVMALLLGGIAYRVGLLLY